MSEGSGRRLMIFGKVPEPGRVKTRLAPALGEEGAAALYRAFLDDTASAVRGVAADRRELWLPRGGESAERLACRYPGLGLRRQPEGDLGAKMAAAFEAAFREGAGRALIVGSDHPTLPGGHLEEALDVLAEADVSLGPTPDGGYWGIGLRVGAWPDARDLFCEVPWSTPDVLDITRRRCAGLGLAVAEVASWYDVDEPGDLERLRRDAASGSATARVLAESDREHSRRPGRGDAGG